LIGIDSRIKKYFLAIALAIAQHPCDFHEICPVSAQKRGISAICLRKQSIETQFARWISHPQTSACAIQTGPLTAQLIALFFTAVETVNGLCVNNLGVI
jgi:hypothetical protein